MLPGDYNLQALIAFQQLFQKFLHPDCSFGSCNIFSEVTLSFQYSLIRQFVRLKSRGHTIFFFKWNLQFQKSDLRIEVLPTSEALVCMKWHSNSDARMHPNMNLASKSHKCIDSLNHGLFLSSLTYLRSRRCSQHAVSAETDEPEHPLIVVVVSDFFHYTGNSE